MCYECWKEFKGWLKAFTRNEALLTILEGILLIICIGFIVFLLLHLIVCASWQSKAGEGNQSITDKASDVTVTHSITLSPSEQHTTMHMHNTLDPSVICTWEPSKKTDKASDVTVTHSITLSTSEQHTTMHMHNTLDPSVTCTWEPSKKTDKASDVTVTHSITLSPSEQHTTMHMHNTLDPSVTCTWEPSKKTEAETHYFESGKKSNKTIEEMDSTITQYLRLEVSVTTPMPKVEVGDSPELGNVDRLAFDEQSDGEEANYEYKSSVLALVKLRPHVDVMFGCIVAVISPHWTLTSASCVEAVEKTDSLDNFLLIERYGSAQRGRTHALADVRVHPLYGGVNRSCDLAALRSETDLRPAATPLALPSPVDYFMITVGERFSILGFGSFRTLDEAFAERAVRSVPVYTVPGAECGGARVVGARSRHLSRGRQGDHAATELCLAVRYARGRACTYCGGTPLVRSGALVGVMAAVRACALACEPAHYVSLAAPPVARWLQLILNPPP